VTDQLKRESNLKSSQQNLSKNPVTADPLMTDPRGAKALEVNDLFKSYGPHRALNGLSFTIERGEIFALLGPNGAGKTSLISILTTLENPTKGEAKIFGHDVVSESHLTKTLVGTVPQEIISHGFFEVQEILQFHSGYYGIKNNKERIDYLLNKLSLFEHRTKKVKQLSGGMKRRLMIAKALVHSPQLLLLDEPTAGVDIELRESLWNFVRELQSEGMTILLTTHYLKEAEELCDRVAVINKGQLCCVSPMREIIANLSRRELSLELRQRREFSHPFLQTQEGAQSTFLMPAKMQVGALLKELNIAVEDIVDLQIQEGGLEEVMKLILREGVQ
jgi:ABC-2 type transport system ATP-binding protein